MGDALEVFEFQNAEQTEEQSSQSLLLRSMLLCVLCVLIFLKKNATINNSIISIEQNCKSTLPSAALFLPHEHR
jgi:hypothetical protein